METDWNHNPIEPAAPHELVSAAEEKKRPAEKRPWEQQPENAARRYRLPENLYGKVSQIATQNNISSISHVAIQLLDYALYQRKQNNALFQIHTRPNPDGCKLRLAWKAGQSEWNSPGRLPPDFERNKKKRRETILPGEYGGRVKDIGLRLGSLRPRIRALADETCLPISDVLTFLLVQAVMAYESGKFCLVLEHIVSRTASGWAEADAAQKQDLGVPGNPWSFSG